MRILNATQYQLSIMADNKQTFQIPPGQLSTPFAGSKSMVMKAVNLGHPGEIGIICSNVYEYQIAQTVTIAGSYLYETDEDAISKLIDKNTDYTNKRSEYQTNNLELSKANNYISELQNEISELKKKLVEQTNNENSATNDDSETINELTSTVNELRGYRVKFEELTKEVKKSYVSKKEMDSAKSNIKNLTDENDKLKEGMEKALKLIDDMKADFKEACKKFNIKKKDAEWVQEDSE